MTDSASTDPTLTGPQAVWRGHRWVSLPALAIMGMGGLVGWLLLPRGGVLLGLVVAVGPAWLWWSYSVPRWRDWLDEMGIPEAKVYRLAVNTGLVFPRGFFFEGTECRRRDGTRGWREGGPLP